MEMTTPNHRPLLVLPLLLAALLAGGTAYADGVFFGPSNIIAGTGLQKVNGAGNNLTLSVTASLSGGTVAVSVPLSSSGGTLIGLGLETLGDADPSPEALVAAMERAQGIHKKMKSLDLVLAADLIRRSK